MKFTIKVNGIGKIDKSLLRKSKNITGAIAEGVNNSAAVVEKDIKKTCPFVTGNLARSIISEFKDNGLTALIGPDFKQAPYAYYVEFGRAKSGKIPPYPFSGRHYMEKSFMRTKSYIKTVLIFAIRKAII